jgi:hypothetical protein
MAALLLLGTLMVASFQNCGTQDAVLFEAGTDFYSREESGGEDLPPIPKGPDAPAENGAGPVVIRPPVICDPFSNALEVNSASGVEGRIYSMGRRLVASNGECLSSTCSSRDYIAKGEMLPAALFMSSIHVPPRDFLSGFTPQGSEPLRDRDGRLLTEFFALDLKSSLVAPPSEPGHYQLAVIADDGVTVTVDGDDLLADEGEHAPRMRCASKSIDLSQSGSRLPIRVTYFQGPRTRISLVLAWRKVPAGQPVPPDCGPFDPWKTAQSELIQDDPSKPLPQGLEAAGWTPIASDNFRVAGQNLCAR